MDTARQAQATEGAVQLNRQPFRLRHLQRDSRLGAGQWLRQVPLLSSTARLWALAKRDVRYKTTATASAAGLDRDQIDDSFENVEEGHYLGLSLEFVGSLGELQTRREALADLL